MDKSVIFVLALRYLYYCKNISYLPDSEYDAFEVWAKNQPGGEILNLVSSDSELDYSPEVIKQANRLLVNMKK